MTLRSAGESGCSLRLAGCDKHVRIDVIENYVLCSIAGGSYKLCSTAGGII